MDKLWAPWRAEYIFKKKEEGCLFCNKFAEKRDEENYIIFRGKYTFVMMNIYPYNNGHLMIAPIRHVGDIKSLTKEEILEMGEMVQKSINAIEKGMKPEGFNIGMNIGKIAGAGVVDHLHIHIVPRWAGDTNFMPIIADTKIIPVALSEAYRILKKYF